MAESDLIQSSDIIAKGFLSPAKKEVEEFITVLEAAKNSLQAVQKESLANIKKIGGATDAKSLKETNTELKKATEARKALEKVEKDLAAGRAIASKALAKQRADDAKAAQAEKKNSDEYIKSQAVRSLQDKQRIALLRAQAIEANNLLGIEQRLLATNARLRIERQQLTGTEVNYKERLKEINDELDKNNQIIKESSDKQKQQSLNVGNYTESIVLAIDKTGIYSSVISKITAFVETYEGIVKASTVATNVNSAATEANAASHVENTVALKAEEAATKKLSLARRALNAITSPVGLLLLAAAAIAAIAKAAYDLNQSFRDQADLIAANGKDILFNTKAYSDYEKALISLRKETRSYQKQIQELSDTEGDLERVAGDQTQVISKRIPLEREAAAARIETAKKELEFAIRQKDLADLAIKREEANPIVGKGNARQEFLDRQEEARSKLFEANDKLVDLVEINAAKERQITDEQIIKQIELIRSKKLGADSEVEILKQQALDEGTILKNRREALDKLTKQQVEAQNEEVRLLQSFGLEKKEIEDLIKTTDGLALQKKLVNLETRLDISQRDELAKVVVEAQKSELDRSIKLDKLREQEIKNAETVLRIQKEINQATLDQTKLDAQSNLAESKGRTSTLEQRSLSRGFLFNRKTRDSTLGSIEEESRRAEELNAAESAALEQRAKDKIEAIRKEVAAETKEQEIGSAEIIQIEQETQNQRLALIEEASQRETEIQSKKANFIKDLQRAQTVEALKQINEVTRATEEELNKRNALQQQGFDRQIAQQEKNVQRQQELATNGRENTLAAEQARLDKEQLAKKEAAEKAARQQELLDLVQQFNGFLQARLAQKPAPNSSQAISGAVADTLIARSIAKGIVQFAAEGNNMIEGPGTTTSDSIPFMLSRKEAVINADANVQHNDAVVDLNAGAFGKNWMPVADFNTAIEQEKNKIRNEKAQRAFIFEQNSRIEDLLTDIKNKPVQMVDVDGLNQMVETVVKGSLKVVTTHKRKPLR